jgi:hypothetical protein
MAHWLRPRSLLRYFASIRCSIRSGTIRASKNSPPRPHLAENKLFRRVLRWNRRPFWPESYNSESHDDPD